jgi:hypothetical protein
MKVTKYLAVALSLATSVPALAHDGHHGGGHGGGGGWVAPFIGGALLGGALGDAYAYPYYAAPEPYYAPTPTQPFYHWDCDPYGRCSWVWR